MWALISGRIFSFGLLIVMFITVSVLTYYSGRMKLPNVRKIPGLDAIEEAIGRCTETGRPVHCSVGDTGGLRSAYAPQVIAGIEVLRFVAALVAKYKTRIIVSTPFSEAIPLIEDTLTAGYADAGVPDYFRGDHVRFIAANAYIAGVLGILTEENCGANIMLGPFGAGTVLWGMAGKAIGALGIAGTARQAQLPYIVVCFDYGLIGEEIFAAGAYVSKDPYGISGLMANDLLRVFTIFLILIGVLFTTMGAVEIMNFLTM